jgi:nitroreductase
MNYNLPGALNPSHAEFPRAGTCVEQWRFLLSYAILAPSGHNVQPWHFKIMGQEVELYADRSRSLPVVDPQDRELTISCGAALFCLRVALRHAGYRGEVTPFPNPGDPDLLARIGFGAPLPAMEEEERLYDSIPKRHTYRLPFIEQQIAGEVLEAIRVAAEQQGAQIRFVREGPVREGLVQLICEADREQLADSRFRREVSAWLRSNESDHHDGVPGYALGMPGLVSHAGPFLARTFDTGALMAAHDRQLCVNAPTLCVLSTEGDTPQEWLATGQTLASLLLHATAEGISASFLNPPLEVPEMRTQVASELGTTDYPQLILRMGYGHEVRPTPRRTVEEVLLGAKPEA